MCWDNIIFIATAIILGFTAFLMYRNNKIAKETAVIQKDALGIQFYKDFMTDYRSSEMKQMIRDLKTKSEKFVKNKEKMINEFVDTTKSGDLSWYDSRRWVSNYYQLIGNLYVKNWISKEVIFSAWSERDLRIIPDIIIPLDTIALPRLRGEKATEPNDYHQSIKNMQKLYEDSKEYEKGR